MGDNVLIPEEPKIIDFSTVQKGSLEYLSLCKLYIEGARSLGSSLLNRSDNVLYKATDRILRTPINAIYRGNLDKIIELCIREEFIGLAYGSGSDDSAILGYLYARVQEGNATVLDMYPHVPNIINPLLQELRDRGAVKICILPTGDSEEYKVFLRGLNITPEGIKKF